MASKPRPSNASVAGSGIVKINTPDLLTASPAQYKTNHPLISHYYDSYAIPKGLKS
jgi:hypothetical protein